MRRRLRLEAPNACHGNRDLALPGESMGGERLDNVAVDERGMVADRMWAVRDPELGSITTARRRPALLRCGARYAADRLGSAPEV